MSPCKIALEGPFPTYVPSRAINETGYTPWMWVYPEGCHSQFLQTDADMRDITICPQPGSRMILLGHDVAGSCHAHRRQCREVWSTWSRSGHKTRTRRACAPAFVQERVWCVHTDARVLSAASHWHMSLRVNPLAVLCCLDRGYEPVSDCHRVDVPRGKISFVLVSIEAHSDFYMSIQPSLLLCEYATNARFYPLNRRE